MRAVWTVVGKAPCLPPPLLKTQTKQIQHWCKRENNIAILQGNWAPPRLETCLHTKEALWKRVCVCELWPPGINWAQRQFSGLIWQHCGCMSLNQNSPFLSAFHHQFLIGSHKLEFGSMLSHTLQSLPNRGHISLVTGTGRIPILNFLLWASSHEFTLRFERI